MAKKAHNVTIEDFIYDQWIAKGNDNLSAFVQAALLRDLDLKRKAIRTCLKCGREREDASDRCPACNSIEYQGSVVFR